MKGFIPGIDNQAPRIAGKHAAFIRHILWELGASVLVATGLVVIFSGFLVDVARRRIRNILFRLPGLDFPDSPAPRKVVASSGFHFAAPKPALKFLRLH